jgi:hypothetical protein
VRWAELPDYLSLLKGMLGDPRSPHDSREAWGRIESSLEVELPYDYKEFIDRYAPVRVNGHLHFDHAADPRWNLGEWVSSTIEAYKDLDWVDLTAPRFISEGPEFGGPEGLIPVFGSDRGECVFLSRIPEKGKWQVVVYVGDDDDFYEYDMGFSEWLYRYLIGEDMNGPNSSAFCPGPVEMENLPMTPGEVTVPFHGPDRGM